MSLYIAIENYKVTVNSIHIVVAANSSERIKLKCGSKKAYSLKLHLLVCRDISSISSAAFGHELPHSFALRS